MSCRKKIRVLTKEQAELIDKATAEDLVGKVLKSLVARGVVCYRDVDELIGVATEALCYAAIGFSPKRGNGFDVYASMSITHAICRYYKCRHTGLPLTEETEDELAEKPKPPDIDQEKLGLLLSEANLDQEELAAVELYTKQASMAERMKVTKYRSKYRRLLAKAIGKLKLAAARMRLNLEDFIDGK